MEDGLDDLFGDVGEVEDGPSLHLPEPLPKGLLQRVDELALSGCCQYVLRSSVRCFMISKKKWLENCVGREMAVLRTSLAMGPLWSYVT